MFEISEPSEAGECQRQEAENYKNIVPEGEWSQDSAREFRNSLFLSGEDLETRLEEEVYPRQETIEGVTYYYDDNGKLYRIGNELEPDSAYELNGYVYQTDSLGRIRFVEGQLHLKERDSRLPMKDSLEVIGKGDQEEGDDRGHLIGDQFDGVNGLENMIPQNAEINRNGFRNFENRCANQLRNGDEVCVKIEPVYEGDSHRPREIIVICSVNGEKTIYVFPNSKEV